MGDYGNPIACGINKGDNIIFYSNHLIKDRIFEVKEVDLSKRSGPQGYNNRGSAVPLNQSSIGGKRGGLAKRYIVNVRSIKDLRGLGLEDENLGKVMDEKGKILANESLIN